MLYKYRSNQCSLTKRIIKPTGSTILQITSPSIYSEHSYNTFIFPYRRLGYALLMFVFVIYITTRKMGVPTAKHSTMNDTVEDLFPYLRHEKDYQNIADIFNEDINLDVKKERDLSIEDVMKREPKAKRGKQFKHIEEVDINVLEEGETFPWPLPPLVGCPKEGALTVEAGGHLGTLLTQFSTIWALSRRDGKYAFMPPGLELPLKQIFTNVSLYSASSITNCGVKFHTIDLDDYEKVKKRDPIAFRRVSFEIKRGPNRAKLYHNYRDDLLKNFVPKAKVSERITQILNEYLATKTKPGEAKVAVGIYLEAEDFEFLKKMKRQTSSAYVSNAIQHFRSVYNKPLFLIRCSNYIWCLQRFKKSLEAELLDKTKNEKLPDFKIFFPAKGKVWKYIDDFSLISSCNHTIILRSHFSWWMAYSSPGYAVVPQVDGGILGNVKSLKLPWMPVEF